MRRITRRSARMGLVATIAAGAIVLNGCTGGGASPGGSASLTQFFHQYGEKGVKEAVIDYAGGYDDGTFSVEWVEGDYAQRVQALLLSGKGVDVFENNAIDVGSARQGKYADLTSLIAPIADKFSPIALKAVTVDGKYYGVPMITDTQLFYYRPSMFEAAGITEPPTTWDELVEDSKKLTTGLVKGLFLGNDVGASVISFNFPAAAGTGLLNDDSTEVTFDSPGFADSLAGVRDLYQSNSLLVGAPTDWYDSTSFIAGQAAITWQGIWAAPEIIKALGDDVGVFALPSIGSSGTPMVGVSQWNEQVAASSPNVEAAIAYVKKQWIDDADWQKKFCVGFGFHIPPVIATAESTPEFTSGLAGDIKKLTDEYGYSAGPYWTPAMSTILQDAVSSVVVDGADAASTITAAQKSAQELLDELNE